MLIKYEFIKIVRRKSTIIVMLLSLLVTAFLFGLPIMQFQTYNQDGVIMGAAGIAHEKEHAAKISVPLTEEFVTETIRNYQRLFENLDNIGYDGNERFIIGGAYWNFVAPVENLMIRTIARNFDRPNQITGLGRLQDMDLQNGANFYERRNEKIEELLNMENRGISENQKAYWRNINSRVETPFQYGYYEGWEIIFTSFELLMFVILAVCIVLAPVFAGEYQAGTDAVVLAAKYGKTKLITAKIISSFLFGFLAFTLHIIAAFGLPLMAFGIDGWNLPVQIWNTIIPYPLTFLQATLINTAVNYTILFAVIGLTLLLSAKMKSPYLVLMIIVPVLFIPLFITPNGTTGLYSMIAFLLPYRAATAEIGRYISYEIGALVIDVHVMRAIIYAMLTLITIPFARMGFKKHQVT